MIFEIILCSLSILFIVIMKLKSTKYVERKSFKIESFKIESFKIEYTKEYFEKLFNIIISDVKWNRLCQINFSNNIDDNINNIVKKELNIYDSEDEIEDETEPETNNKRNVASSESSSHSSSESEESDKENESDSDSGMKKLLIKKIKTSNDYEIVQSYKTYNEKIINDIKERIRC